MQAIMSVLLLPLRLLGTMAKKDDKLWVFGAWSGKRYTDNSKYLYEYIVRHQPGHRAVWLTKSAAVHRRLEGLGLPVSYFYSPAGIWYAIRARYLVMCVSYDDLSIFCYLFPHHAKLINLWHGTPMKRLAASRNPKMARRRQLLLCHLRREYDHICSASGLVTEQLRKYFTLPETDYLETGYPRNDALSLPTTGAAGSQEPGSLGSGEGSGFHGLSQRMVGRKVITYMPTFREYRKLPQSQAGKSRTHDGPVDLLHDFEFDPVELDRTLAKYNAILLIKTHYRDVELHPRISMLQTERIALVEDDDIDDDVYPLLARTDILITDYSSVFFDYLLLDRPIIFASFDLAYYQSLDRGFYFDYADMTPGPKAANWKEVSYEIESVLTGRHEWAPDRARVCDLVNRYRDAGNSRRVFEAITSRTAHEVPGGLLISG